MPDSSGHTGDPPPALPSTLTELQAGGLPATFTMPPGALPFTGLTPHARGGLGEVFRGTDRVAPHGRA